MPGDVGERGQALRMAGLGVLGIAAGVAIQVEEEAELDFTPAHELQLCHAQYPALPRLVST